MDMRGHTHLPKTNITENFVFCVREFRWVILVACQIPVPCVFVPQSAVGFEYQGKTEKHASQKGKGADAA